LLEQARHYVTTKKLLSESITLITRWNHLLSVMMALLLVQIRRDACRKLLNQQMLISFSKFTPFGKMVRQMELLFQQFHSLFFGGITGISYKGLPRITFDVSDVTYTVSGAFNKWQRKNQDTDKYASARSRMRDVDAEASALVIHDVDVTNMDTPMVSGGETFTQSLKKIVREAECRADGGGFKTPKSDPIITDNRHKLPAKRQYRRLSIVDRSDEEVPRPDLSFLTPQVVKEARSLALENSKAAVRTKLVQKETNSDDGKEAEQIPSARASSADNQVEDLKANESLRDFEDEILNDTVGDANESDGDQEMEE